jgi:hypothetical protein
MTDRMDMVIDLETVKEFLKMHYKKIYPNCDDIEVHYYLEKETRCFDDELYTVYPLCAKIDIIKKIGNAVTRAGVIIENDDLEKELQEELAILYNTDEYELSLVIVPEFKKSKINTNDEEIKLIFKKRKEKELIKK